MKAFEKHEKLPARLAVTTATLICVIFLTAAAASAKTITVTGTGDSIAVDGAVTLREAITAANTNAPSGDAPAGDPGLDTITFNIPGNGVRTINLTAELPAIIDPITIDGYTQPGASANTMTVGSNAVLLIELNGTNAGSNSSALTVTAGNSTIKGLVINRFSGRGVNLQINGVNAVRGNFIGTDASGTSDFPSPNNGLGIYIESPNNTIGGTLVADRNIISGNGISGPGGAGVWIDGAAATGNKIVGNYLGTDASGTVGIPNYNEGVLLNNTTANIIGGTTPAERNLISGGGYGILIAGSSSDNQIMGNFMGTKADGVGSLGGSAGIILNSSTGHNTIGGTQAGAGNLIAFNSQQGIFVSTTSVNNPILGNAIYSNLSLGIDLYSGAFGVTPNDDNTGDADTGANNLQNFPVLTSVVAAGGNTTIQGTLDSAPNTQFRVEFFSNTNCDASGFGQGEKFIGFANVMTNATGKGNFSSVVPTASVVGSLFTATATDPAGNTSEFSACAAGAVSSPGTLQLSTNSQLKLENAGSFALDVTRTNGSAGTVTVHYTTADATAKAPSDYTATSGTLTFNDGETSKPLSIPIIDDNTPEGLESFTLTLSNPTGGAALGGITSANLVIQDNEEPTLSINNVNVAEGNSGTTNATFTVTLSDPITDSVTVDFGTAPGTATSGNDYQPASGTLTFAPGELSKQVIVVVNGDTTNEPDETFFVNLSNPSNATVSKAQGTGTIVNDDNVAAQTLQFSSANYTIQEGAGAVTITVSRSGDTSGSATVDYQTTDTDTFTVGCAVKQGTAYGRCDFATTVGSLSFAAGQTSRTFAVPIIDDSYAEGSETFSVVLSNAVGGSLGAVSTATITINDNEVSDGPNPIFNTPFFVRQHYLDFLGREPEVGEPWSAILNGCADVNNTDPNNPSAGCDRITVSGSFFGSPEFKNKGLYVIDFYRVAFNRLPQYTEFSVDLASITGATAAEANTKRAAFATNLGQRSEFITAYGAMTNSAYVNALMNGTMGQGYNLTTISTVDPMNPDGPTKVTLTTTDLINALNSNTLTRAQVLRAIVQSDQITANLEAVNAFVASQYYGYLRRTPEAAGFNNWVNYLKNNPNDFRTMVNGFLNSTEYHLRFGP